MQEAIRTAERATVLVVDDEVAIRIALQRALEGQFDVLTCDCADEALTHVKRGGLDVVVSDLVLPGVTGVQLLKEIREYQPDLPVVLITGQPELESATRAIELGAFRYVAKPVDLHQFRDTVDQAARFYQTAMSRRRICRLGGSTRFDSLPFNPKSTAPSIIETMWIAYQPIVSASERIVFGYEALMRSTDPALRSPGDLIRAAKRPGLPRQLGRTARERAISPMRGLSASTLLFVNLHPWELFDPELTNPQSSLGALAAQVVLEITERAPLDELGDVRPRVAALREMGFRIALNDLGAGYAGLSWFALLEPEIAKVEMSLVRGVNDSPLRQKLIGAIAALCKDTGKLVVAEGVETNSERDTLVELGCDLLQGYLFARPGPPFPVPRW